MKMFRFEVRRLQKTALIGSGISIVFVFIFMALFPSMENSGIQELVITKFDAFPEGFMKAFGLDRAVNFNDVMHYMAYTLQYIVMALAIFGMTLGLDSLLLEEMEGTIEFLYAQPLSRKEIFWGKVTSHSWILVQSLLLIGFFSFLSAWFFKPESLSSRELGQDVTELFLGSLLVCSMYFSIGVFLGSFLHRRSAGLAMGVFFLTYLIGFLARLKEGFGFLRYFSPFDYALSMDIVRKGWDPRLVIVGTMAIVFFTLLAYVLYQKKDFNI